MYRCVLALLFLLAGCKSAGDTRSGGSAESASAMSGSSATLVVHGMGCPMCANNIDRQLLKVSGVQKVKIDLSNGNVSVQFAADAHPLREQLVDAVQQSGFTLVEIRQP